MAGNSHGKWNWVEEHSQTSSLSSQNASFKKETNTKISPFLRQKNSTSKTKHMNEKTQRLHTRINVNPISTVSIKNKGDIEIYSGLRIKDRVITASELRTEMKDRKYIHLHNLDEVPPTTFQNPNLDWVTIGVITRKTVTKASANGSSFLVWSLSDLETTELGVFLFQDAYEHHWKVLEGTIVAIVNATLIPSANASVSFQLNTRTSMKTNMEGSNHSFALRVNAVNEVVILGTAVDYGICLGTTVAKTRCSLAVNISKTKFCIHHLAKKFLDVGKGRHQLNNTSSGWQLTKGTSKQNQVTQSVFTTSKGKNLRKNISAGVYTGLHTNSMSTKHPTDLKQIQMIGAKRKSGHILPDAQKSGNFPEISMSTFGNVVERLPKAIMQNLNNTVRENGKTLKKQTRGQKLIASISRNTNKKIKKSHQGNINNVNGALGGGTEATVNSNKPTQPIDGQTIPQEKKKRSHPDMITFMTTGQLT